MALRIMCSTPFHGNFSSEQRTPYLVAFVAISILTAFIVPLVYYIGYYSYKAIRSLCGRVQPSETAESPPIDSHVPEIVQEAEILSPSDQQPRTLLDEIELTRHLDKAPTNRSWLKFGNQIGETQQTFSDFVARVGEPAPRPLYVQLIGDFSPQDREVIAQVIEFLKVFHRKEVLLSEKNLSMEELKRIKLADFAKRKSTPSEVLPAMAPENGIQIKRRVAPTDFYTNQFHTQFPRADGQYLADIAIDALNVFKQENLPANCDLIAFTKEDLFARALTNYVFGLAQYGGSGIWSQHRFGSDPRQLLLRMLKLSTHEFGHSRVISHCVEKECNMGGYMSVDELDKRPLWYCAEDSAKICYLTGITMKQYYQDLLVFMRKQPEIFSNEINHLEQALSCL